MLGRLSIAIALTILAALAPPAAAAVKKADPERPLPLHATRGENPGVFNSRGAEVLLRGVNVVGLGEYYQANPLFPPTVPLKRKDFRQIAKIGFNSVRLIIHWSRLEPERGAFNRTYVQRIRRKVRQAKSFGLYTVLDMHQDAWGPHIDTEPDEVCPPGTNRAVGWDGAPEWATITDGASTCHLGLRELSPAVGQAWQSFYEDREGIQSHLIEVWRKLARAFAGNRAVAGYDLLNEPNPGLAPGVNDTGPLGEFYGRTIDAIRDAEGSRRRGFEHIVFFEPGVAWSAAGTYPVPPADFTADTNIVFAPHIYAEAISQNSIEDGFAWAQQTAEGYGVTVWSGEWGFFSAEPEDDRDRVTRFGQAGDEYLFGDAWWDWKQACGDPHVIHEPGGEPDPISPSLIRIECPSQKQAPRAHRAYRDMLSRPAPRAAPGEITKLRSDGAEGTLELAGTTGDSGRSCALRVFVPFRARRATVSTKGVSRLRTRRVLGDRIIRGCVDGRYEVRVG